MNRPIAASLIILGLLLSAAPAPAQQHDGGTPDGRRMAGQGDTASRDMMAKMARMDHDMGAAQMTGNPDHDFVAMMLPHHQGAIDMAQIELRYGKDPEMRRLASEIVAAQNREITLMKRWQASRVAR